MRRGWRWLGLGLLLAVGSGWGLLRYCSAAGVKALFAQRSELKMAMEAAGVRQGAALMLWP